MNKKKFNELIAGFDFDTLFINELGWNNFNANHPILLPKTDTTFSVTGVAEKKDFPILLCSSTNGKIPDYFRRKQIDRIISKNLYFDHLIIFIDKNKTAQLWQLPLKEEGKPSRLIQINWYKNQDAESLYQRLRNIVFTLKEEDIVTLADVKARVNLSLSANSDKNIKKFYNDFKNQHKVFLGYIKGIDDNLSDDTNINKKWYASLMLNRLMFCYFIQKRKFLNWDDKYLTNKLVECKNIAGKNSFYGFYRSFLLELFHNGLAYPEEKRKKPTCPVSFGTIPYLNGGLFDVHELEKNYANITIKDEAFDKIFALFDQYEWHLDTRQQSSGKEVNPDVIGYIFEKYINDRASMGAYYTKEDITDYIGKNTIIPFILDKVKSWHKEPFENGGAFWQYLQTSDGDYIYDSVKQGIPENAKNINELDIPANIKIGIDTKNPNLLERRKDWNTATAAEFALPTEIWRETITRFERYFEVRNKIASGEIQQVNDLITYNLNIKKLLSDFLEQTQDAKFIRTLYKVLPTVTILDPTCGSGAFLFAAMNILEHLYEICINRMEEIYKASPSKNDDFRQRLEDIYTGNHPNLKYYIYKTIILNNLYGVDIMNEAVEIAKLRLFLKLVAEVDPSRSKKNYGLEPLPDIDFNIKAGNTLIGFATEKQIENAFRDEFNFDTDTLNKIKQKCDIIAAEFKHFKNLQLGTGYISAPMHKIKSGLQDNFTELNKDLDKYLAKTYEINAETDKKDFDEWKQSHQPFHWFSEFYQIVAENGGFDVVIGNPPYVEYAKIKNVYTIKNYQTEKCGNLYTFVIEKALRLLRKDGKFGMIIPLSICCGERMLTLRDLYIKKLGVFYISNFEISPSKLFEEAYQRLSIIVGGINNDNAHYISKLHRWYKTERENLINNLYYTKISLNTEILPLFGKYRSINHLSVFSKIKPNSKPLFDVIIKSKEKSFIYYQEATNYWVKMATRVPYFKKNGNIQAPDHGRFLYFKNKKIATTVLAILNSSLFYLWHSTYSDGFHLSDMLVKNYLVDEELLSISTLYDMGLKLEVDIKSKSIVKPSNTKNDSIEMESFNVSKSKSIIDEIDKALAKHYGFTEEELDFIINYDIKYRMGGELETETGEEES